MTTLTDIDREHLRHALALAEGGRGRVSPNPLVGAVVVRGGKVIGEGFHAELGGLHAERAALADCGRRGEEPGGATMYVTLEPCAHQGRQPPCTEAILAAGIGRVVIASEDPSEKAAGRGPGILRDGGVEVEAAAGAEAAAARLLNQPFRKHARTGLPLVVLKLAMSLDGQITTPAGSSPWISGERSRELVHRWRGELDAIAVGIGTALADDPLLTARAPGARQPHRVVFDSAARLPLGSRLVGSIEQAPLTIVAGPEAPPERVAALREAGVEVFLAEAVDPGERILAALATLGRREVTSLLLEGGRTLVAAFAACGQVDESRTFVAPMLLGPPDSSPNRSSFVNQRVTNDERTGTAPRLEALATATERVGEDTLITARYREW
ncbi:MAG: bifunctional diaminohydroxyphosphoribosylaminopyrimidine deaminase/5-amino-6-(5-phosphoribosylamino)uracil reductase RibD [Actinobacteria bacterium]|nr:bifunctional diaminohydroxyphosphoribosylaminopyrimidine deaminase/5-amino-6-(5-phosphoribosylamino)uracil reductase RibD [Actinomycetota bacterium]